MLSDEDKQWIAEQLRAMEERLIEKMREMESEILRDLDQHGKK